jgi:RNA ligase (TIGR02306 family)
VFVKDEPVIILEKVDGSNAKYVYSNGEMFVGSRTLWKKENATNLWWKAYNNTPSIEKFCKENPDYILCGEAIGNNGKMPYGKAKGNIRFLAFDIMYNGYWLNWQDFKAIIDKYNIPCVPIIDECYPFNMDNLKVLAEGPSLVPGADHIREGIVIHPPIERSHPSIGRVQLKLVSSTYLEKK